MAQLPHHTRVPSARLPSRDMATRQAMDRSGTFDPTRGPPAPWGPGTLAQTHQCLGQTQRGPMSQTLPHPAFVNPHQAPQLHQTHQSQQPLQPHPVQPTLPPRHAAPISMGPQGRFPQHPQGPPNPAATMLPPRAAGKPAPGPEPWGVGRRCSHHACVMEAMDKSNFCNLHRCPSCGNDKRSQAPTCAACGNQPGKGCMWTDSNGARCTNPAGPYCALHACPCGLGKSSKASRCDACRDRNPNSQQPDQPRLGCRVCGGDTAPGEHLCGTCRLLSLAEGLDRQKYVMEVGAGKPTRPNRFLFIWDFDQTITRQHASNTGTFALTPEQIESNLVDSMFFRECIGLLNHYGHHTKIATWADGRLPRYVLHQYLEYLFGPNETRPYLRNEGIEAFRPDLHNLEAEGKNGHIKNLVRQLETQGISMSNQRVILFDDRERNVRLARANKYGAIHCPDGFTRQSWRRFMDLCAKENASLPEFTELWKIAARLPSPPVSPNRAPQAGPVRNDGRPDLAGPPTSTPSGPQSPFAFQGPQSMNHSVLSPGNGSFHY